MFPNYFINSKLKKTKHQKEIIKLISNYGNQSKITIIEKLFKKEFEKIKNSTKRFTEKQTELNNFFKKHYPYVFNLVKELQDGKKSKLKIRMLQKAEKKKGFTKTEHDEEYHSRPQQYYSLTEESLEWLIN